jgi:hypothetical protein
MKAVQMLQVAAHGDGRAAVNEYDCLLLEHVFGNRPDDSHKVRAQVLDIIASDPGLQQTELVFLGLFGRCGDVTVGCLGAAWCVGTGLARGVLGWGCARVAWRRMFSVPALLQMLCSSRQVPHMSIGKYTTPSGQLASQPTHVPAAAAMTLPSYFICIYCACILCWC